ncbi:lipid kinase [Geminicoccaceae bacterium 1502E]|nr:lipid kinase [Geminicoccaceae bacterium 1502E]
MRRHALVFVNRGSRQGEEQAERALGLLREAGFSLEACPAESKHSAPDFLREHARGADLVVLGGGDGTLNRAADALVEIGLPLGILPLGTGNDLARTLGLPLDLAGAVAVIRAGRTERVDIGRVNGKPFFNAATIGLSVEAGRCLDGALKKRLGPAAYVRTIIDALRRNRSFLAEIEHPDGKVRRRSIQLTIGNGRHHGAGMTVSEAAAIDDHQFDVYSLDPQPWWWLLRHLPELRRGGSSNGGGIWRSQAPTLTVRTRPALPVSTDGDLTTSTPAEFTIDPSALEIFVPG